jgi:uncharacterized protein (UPF0248 family)
VFRWKHPRPVLNEIKWRYNLSKCRVHFIHRGMPGDIRIVDGRDIKNIDRSYLVLESFPEDIYIPYHRIFMIEYNGEIVYEHHKKALEKKKN